MRQCIMTDEAAIKNILKENRRRNEEMFAKFDPYTGEGSILARTELVLPDFFLRKQWIPLEMARNKEVKLLKKHGSIRRYVEKALGMAYTETAHKSVADMIVYLRCKYDFCFWAAMLAYISNKNAGDVTLFILNKPQRKVVSFFEEMRLAGKPIRMILVKARQWGGSTLVQLYMAWLQTMRKKGLNSLICSHVGKSSAEIEDMFRTFMAHYPVKMLHPFGDACNEKEPKWEGVSGMQGIHRIPQRGCKVKMGSAESPDSCRGGAYSLVHCSEVGLWKKTEGKSPEDIAQSAMSGILLKPYTMIVLESTAKGVGNYFYREYKAAVEGESQFKPMFVAWWEIEQYRMGFAEEAEKGEDTEAGIKCPKHLTAKQVRGNKEKKDEEAILKFLKYMTAKLKGNDGGMVTDAEKAGAEGLTEKAFACQLWRNRKNDDAESDRCESGKYLWWLWELGASLEGIHWYVEERKKYGEHGRMASEYPSDATEAFVNSGANVFDRQLVARLEKTCRAARWIGELEGDAKVGEVYGFAGLQELAGIGERGVLDNIHFVEDRQSGRLHVWEKPEPDEGDTMVKDRYLVVVDIGGRGTKADWSVVLVLDRLWMMDGGKPCVVAQWYGHTDMDVLAWKAAQIAKWYNDALLVIESNTLETKDRDRYVDGDQSAFILLQVKGVYDNLYARKQSEEDIREGAPVKYGFHTNMSTKPMIISTLIKVVRDNMYTERDEGVLYEYNCYERKQNGSYAATTGNHDDKLMTRAIGLHICFYEMDMPKIVPKVKAISSAWQNRTVTEATIY